MSERMKDRLADIKPRVYKRYKGGMWWADVRVDGVYFCEPCHTYEAAVEQAHKYALMVRSGK
jgi:hypothetical protein